MTKQEIVKREICRLEKTKKPAPDACFLLSSSIVGPNVERIYRWIGRGLFTRDEARRWGARLREQGIWCGEKLAVEWFDKKNGGVGFLADVLVMRGLLQRAK